MREIRDEFGCEGHIIMIESKTTAEWIKQARNAMDRAVAYGATITSQMRAKEQDELRQALKALGLNPEF